MSFTATSATLNARFVEGVDGDSFVLWIARFGSFNHYATVDEYRLRGWRAREHNQGPELAADGSLVRVDGKTATEITTSVLRGATHIKVVEYGRDSWGRVLADVTVEDHDLGEVLAAQKVCTPGSTMGMEA